MKVHVAKSVFDVRQGLQMLSTGAAESVLVEAAPEGRELGAPESSLVPVLTGDIVKTLASADLSVGLRFEPGSLHSDPLRESALLVELRDRTKRASQFEPYSGKEFGLRLEGALAGGGAVGLVSGLGVAALSESVKALLPNYPVARTFLVTLGGLVLGATAGHVAGKRARNSYSLVSNTHGTTLWETHL